MEKMNTIAERDEPSFTLSRNRSASEVFFTESPATKGPQPALGRLRGKSIYEPTGQAPGRSRGKSFYDPTGQATGLGGAGGHKRRASVADKQEGLDPLLVGDQVTLACTEASVHGGHLRGDLAMRRLGVTVTVVRPNHVLY